MFNKVFLKSV